MCIRTSEGTHELKWINVMNPFRRCGYDVVIISTWAGTCCKLLRWDSRTSCRSVSLSAQHTAARPHTAVTQRKRGKKQHHNAVALQTPVGGFFGGGVEEGIKNASLFYDIPSNFRDVAYCQNGHKIGHSQAIIQEINGRKKGFEETVEYFWSPGSFFEAGYQISQRYNKYLTQKRAKMVKWVKCSLEYIQYNNDYEGKEQVYKFCLGFFFNILYLNIFKSHSETRRISF